MTEERILKMAHLLPVVFSNLKYAPLLSALNVNGIDFSEEIKPQKKKRKISILCDRGLQLLEDVEFWNSLMDIITPFRLLRFRHSIYGRIIKGIFILHKDRSKQIYDYCKQNYIKVFLFSHSKKYNKVIVTKKINENVGIDVDIINRNATTRVRQQRPEDDEKWNKYMSEIRAALGNLNARSSSTRNEYVPEVEIGGSAPTAASRPTNLDEIQVLLSPTAEEPTVARTSNFPNLSTDSQETMSPPADGLVFLVEAEVHVDAGMEPAKSGHHPLLHAIEMFRVSTELAAKTDGVSFVAPLPRRICPARNDFIATRPTVQPVEEPHQEVRFDEPITLALSPPPAGVTSILGEQSATRAGQAHEEPVHMEVENVEPLERGSMGEIEEITREKETVEKLLHDFDRIGIIEGDVSAASVQNQVEIPDIIFTEPAAPLIAVNAERAIESVSVMEITDDPANLLETRDKRKIGVTVNQLLGESDSEREVKRKIPKKKKLIFYTQRQMKAMINRPLVKNAEPPTLTAEIFTNIRPNVLSPLRLMSQNRPDIHDIWEAPMNYADVLKNDAREKCKLNLKQLIPFCPSTIFSRKNFLYSDPITEEDKKAREKARRALSIITNFPKTPITLIRRFNEEQRATRPSFRSVAENQLLDAPVLDHQHSIHESRKSDRLSAPLDILAQSATNFPLISENLHLTNVDMYSKDDNILIPLLPPLLTPPVAAPQEDLNRIEIVPESRMSIEQSIPKPSDDTFEARRDEVLATKESTAIETRMNGIEIATVAQPRTSAEEIEINSTRPRRVKIPDVLNKLRDLFRRKTEPLKFVDVCPRHSSSRMEAAKTFFILLELHAEKKIALMNEEQGLSYSNILIYSKCLT